MENKKNNKDLKKALADMLDVDEDEISIDISTATDKDDFKMAISSVMVAMYLDSKIEIVNAKRKISQHKVRMETLELAASTFLGLDLKKAAK